MGCIQWATSVCPAKSLPWIAADVGLLAPKTLPYQYPARTEHTQGDVPRGNKSARGEIKNDERNNEQMRAQK